MQYSLKRFLSYVLKPFFGSGTTGYVAQRLQRKWVGIELNPDYIKIAEQRFKQQELFAPHGSEMEEINIDGEIE